MLFHIQYQFSPDARKAAQARFKETGGGPPDRATMVGRWHASGGLQGYLIAEASDLIPVGKCMQEWTDLLTFEITPVLNDEQVMEVIG